MTKQELLNKIKDIIFANYSEDYVLDNDDNEISVDYFRLNNCIEEIEALFKEVE